jgi:hypothetical protein
MCKHSLIGQKLDSTMLISLFNPDKVIKGITSHSDPLFKKI